MGKNQKKRLYTLDENGTQFFWYKDQDTNFIIGAAMPIDKDIRKLRMVANFLREKDLKKLIVDIDRGDNQDHDLWIGESRVGKVIAAIDVSYNSACAIEVSYYFKNDTMQKSYEQMLRRSLYNLGKDEMKSSVYHLTSAVIDPIYECE